MITPASLLIHVQYMRSRTVQWWMQTFQTLIQKSTGLDSTSFFSSLGCARQVQGQIQGVGGPGGQHLSFFGQTILVNMVIKIMVCS